MRARAARLTSRRLLRHCGVLNARWRWNFTRAILKLSENECNSEIWRVMQRTLRNKNEDPLTRRVCAKRVSLRTRWNFCSPSL